MSSLIKHLRDNDVDTIANVTDALYDNDPNGTMANDAYLKANVHNYLRELGLVVSPEREYFVSGNYLDDGNPLGTPFFPKIQSATTAESCYTQIASDGSGANNKVIMNVGNKPDAYSDNLNFNHNGFVTVRGKCPRNCVVSGTLTISDGVHIIENLGFTGDITISGGITVIRNCVQTAGAFNITGSATVIILDCDQWGGINVSDSLTGVSLWVKGCMDIRLIPATSNSILLPSGLISLEAVFRGNRLRGILSNDGDLEIENVLNKENASAFPAIS